MEFANLLAKVLDSATERDLEEAFSLLSEEKQKKIIQSFVRSSTSRVVGAASPTMARGSSACFELLSLTILHITTKKMMERLNGSSSQAISLDEKRRAVKLAPLVADILQMRRPHQSEVGD